MSKFDLNVNGLIGEVSRRSGLSRSACELALKAILETISQAVGENGKVKLKGFGTFSSVDRKQRTARNPKTNEEMLLPQCKRPKFKAGPDFIKSVDNEYLPKNSRKKRE